MVLPFTSYCVLNANTPPSIHRSGYIPFRWYEPLSGDGDGGDDGVAVNAHHLLFYIYVDDMSSDKNGKEFYWIDGPFGRNISFHTHKQIDMCQSFETNHNIQ